jgi:DNA-directed RNA polymerase specialized sigma24 family protein
VAAPRDPSEPAVDWQDLRASIHRRLRFHLRGWPDAEVDDATQDVLYKVLRFLERSGAPDNLEGLVTVIARRTAVERIRARSRRPAHEPVAEHTAVTPDDADRHELAELEDQTAWRAFLVIEFFREKHAPCVELAEARSRGVDFKLLAGQTNQSHLALLQRWSRCMRRLRAAIDAGKLPWDGPERRT